MKWRKIKDISPNNATIVLLSGRYESEYHYCLGLLGGCKNAPEFRIDIKGYERIIPATHWCKLCPPK